MQTHGKREQRNQDDGGRIDEIIDDHKKKHPQKKRDWRTYEQDYAQRAKTAFHDLEPLVEKAVSSINIIRFENRGNEPQLTLKQKTLLILIKRFIGKSNRAMEWMAFIFSLLSESQLLKSFFPDDRI